MILTYSEGAAMLNSFAKDWKHWSTTERVAAELFGVAWIGGLLSQILLYLD